VRINGRTLDNHQAHYLAYVPSSALGYLFDVVVSTRKIKAQFAAGLRYFAVSHAIEELLSRRIALSHARQDTRAFERVRPVLFVE
jgi:hypothetical protein